MGFGYILLKNSCSLWEFALFILLGGRKLKQVAWGFVNDRYVISLMSNNLVRIAFLWRMSAAHLLMIPTIAPLYYFALCIVWERRCAWPISPKSSHWPQCTLLENGWTRAWTTFSATFGGRIMSPTQMRSKVRRALLRMPRTLLPIYIFSTHVFRQNY